MTFLIFSEKKTLKIINLEIESFQLVEESRNSKSRTNKLTHQ